MSHGNANTSTAVEVEKEPMTACAVGVTGKFVFAVGSRVLQQISGSSDRQQKINCGIVGHLRDK